ncbi:transposase [uncultured Paludibaculum sp.]|uniref:transposase n=1 Tax=uncultured Paludibaculum sp. TaxID=1765020 RepID=UPI002AAB7271|nr:transposase [uncultured Paludibaculum sp.]
MTYLITFVCYGCHLHGSEEGSVDRRHNRVGSPALDINPARANAAEGLMGQAPYTLDQIRRDTVLAAIVEACGHRGWMLLAAHVRSSHVHAVVDAEAAPERVMIDFKAYASRKLNRMGLDGSDRKRWARHGSTRWLWEPRHISAAVQYVIAEQGTKMSVFEPKEE